MFLNKLVEPLKDYKIILASGSPRRKEILTNLGVDFKIIKSNFEEDLPHDSFEKPEFYCMETAKQKCLEVYHRLISDQKLINDNDLNGEKGLIISADSIVVKDNKILEKPLSEQDAFEKLSMLRGSSHHVISSLVLIPFDLSTPKSEEVFMDFDKTEVTFSDEIADQDLWAYIETKEPMDKAGGYGYQGLASLFIPKINGCYFNVVGFPIHKFYTLLKKVFPQSAN